MSRLHASILAVAAFAAAAATVQAQDRMPPIPPEKMTEAQKRAAEEFVRARGTGAFGPFAPLMRSPELMIRAQAVGEYLRFHSPLPARLREFTILLTARQWTQEYEWTAHQPLAAQAGLKPEIIAAVADGRRPDRMSDDEQVVYAVWDELRRNQSVSDATYATSVGALGEQGLMDTIGLVGYYSMLSMVMNTARTPLAAGVKPPLVPFPR